MNNFVSFQSRLSSFGVEVLVWQSTHCQKIFSGRQNRLVFQNNHSAIVHCNTVVSDMPHTIKKAMGATICAKMCATLQCYKVKDQLSVAEHVQLLFDVTFKEGADCSDDQSLPFSRYQYFSCSSEVILLFRVLHHSNV